LIGRAGPLAVLAEHLTYAAAGHVSAVMVSGPPGVGKTRLVDEFLSSEQVQRASVLRGGASLAEGMPPYLPFLQALGDYISAASIDVLAKQVGAHGPTLATLLPELVQRLGAQEPDVRVPPEQQRFRLYEAVTTFVVAIAASQPLVLFFDDLHWADVATLDLLVHVAGRSRGAALLIVGAYREGEAADNAALERAIAELNRRRLLVSVPVEALTADETGALAANLLGGGISSQAAEVVHSQSEGNPFFVEELLRALVEDGSLRRKHGHWNLDAAPDRTLPPRVAAAIRVRLARFEPAVVDTLRPAAVIGRAFDPAVLARALQQDLDQVDDLLRAAARAQLLVRRRDGTYSFSHDMVRETLVSDLAPARRRRLHQAVAEVLEARRDGDPAQRTADLAFHFVEAGDRARGLEYAMAAGEHALHASAATVAVAHFRNALRLLGAAGEPAARATALIGVGDATTLAGDYTAASEAFRGARDAWLQGGNPGRAAAALHRLGKVHWRQEHLEAARQAFEQALQLLGSNASSDLAGTLLELADLHVTSFGQNSVGLGYAQRALSIVEQVADRRLESSACCVLGNVKARSNELDEARAWLERGLALAQEIDDPTLAAEACAYLANLYAWTGDLNRSRDVSVLRSDLAQRTHDLFQLRHVYAWIGQLDLLQGRWTEAQHWFAQQQQVVDALDTPEPRAELHLSRGILHYYLGRFAEAAHELGQAVDLLRPVAPATTVWHLGWLARTLAELGRADEAMDCLRQLQGLVEGLDERARARGNGLAQLAVGYARLGDPQRAAACYTRLLPFQGQLSPVLIDRGLGVAALSGGDIHAARRHFADAEAQAARAGMRPELALVLLQHGTIDPSHQAQGVRLCADLGMHELGRRRASPTVPAPRQTRHVAGLTERELQVLRLVADGRANREIAEMLVLSENTVARHLTSIFTKTGVENRAGATAFALRQGLA
jgi:DNA-binding CsgD family transcriptional regulator/tetratricopeptide (TPR) repeat protein